MASKTKKKRKNLPLLAFIEAKKKEAQEVAIFWDGLRQYMQAQAKAEEEGLITTLYRCPAGTVLDEVVRLFWEKTDIPLNMVYWMTLTLLSGYLTQTDVSIILGDQVIRPNLWTLILGESGIGKTWSIQTITKAMEEDVCVHEPSYQSKAAFVMDLNQNPEARKAVVVIDEFGQVLKLIHDRNTDLKQAFLLAYDGQIEHTTKKEGKIVVPDVAISILAATVLSVFHQVARPEDLLDGLMQRFLLVEARMHERRLENWPYIVSEQDLWPVKKACKEFVERVQTCKKLKPTPEAIEVWKKFYCSYWNPDLESHYKRYMFVALKLAAIFYYLVDGIDGEINHRHMGWALRALHDALSSLYNFMANKGFSHWTDMANRVEKTILLHPKATVRDLLRRLNLRKAHLEVACRILVQRGSMSPQKFKELFGKEVWNA